MPAAAELSRVCAALAGRQTPALVWHGTDGERIELSGRVTQNWIAKTANLLSEEFDAGPDVLVRLRLSSDGAPQVHWRSLIVAAAAWWCGAEALFAGPGEDWDEVVPDPASTPSAVLDVVADADARLTAGPAGAAEETIAVALPGLALASRLPEHAPVFDYTGEVRAHADVFSGAPPAAPSPSPGSGACAPAGSFVVPWRPEPHHAASHGLPPGAVVRVLAALEGGAAVGLSDLRDPAQLQRVFAAEGIPVATANGG
ncbi:TIGR03089 family protein [Sediminivirga luteola]|uniref:TIGR03089 family protein n=1 Tax=Sediminivirga luteola TaxID=1774748 RepID=UPI001F56890F|nr:TIGR03089 family protein [Sediminivirga luteola]MCI2265584.1 hypothetical protein [Sediminivirga luteola]